MANARIYKPAKNAMQSGKASTKKWVLEFEPVEAKSLDPLMGWAGSGDMRAQVKLRFDSAAAAQAYAERIGLDAEVIAARAPKLLLRAYADRFAYNRVR
ncbi:MAG: ETC complex I subunit [Rhodospirillales bacterium]|nr:ETC complex I subunit [Rhodospirillales bacterium]